jgi:tetrahydromethanopterin S-methyltransferase subunit F
MQDYITNDMIGHSMQRHEDSNSQCSVDISGNPYMLPNLVFDDTPRGDGSGFRYVGLSLETESNLIKSSPIYMEYNADGNLRGQVEFCLRVELRMEDGRLVNFVDIEFTLFMFFKHVDFEAGKDNRRDLNLASESNYDNKENLHDDGRFSLQSNNEDLVDQGRRHLLNCFDGFGVVLNVGTQSPTASPVPTAPTVSPAPTPASTQTDDDDFTINVKPHNFTQGKRYFNTTDFYNVEAYLCDDDLNPLDSSSVRTQASGTLRVCVQRNAKCVRDSVFMKQIDAFSFFRDGYRQVAIAPVGQEAANGLTELHCQRASHMCWFETLLSAQFFTSPGWVAGSGSATLQFGSATERRLQENNDNLGKTRGINFAFELTTDEFVYEEEVVTKEQEHNEGLSSFGCVGIVVGFLLLFLVMVSLLFFWRTRTNTGSRHDKIKKPTSLRTRAMYIMGNDDDGDDEAPWLDERGYNNNGSWPRLPEMNHSREEKERITVTDLKTTKKTVSWR